MSLPLEFLGASELLVSLDWCVLPSIPPCCLLLYGKGQALQMWLGGLWQPFPNQSPCRYDALVFCATASMLFSKCSFDLDFPAFKDFQMLLVT